jgi:ABC-type lipoprotein release transport system permease subunit
MVVGNSAASVGIGCLLGLLVAVGLARALSTSAQEIDARNPFSYFAVLLAVVVVAFIASYAPARRASRVEPVVALRCE